jgi:hypothetical protein
MPPCAASSGVAEQCAATTLVCFAVVAGLVRFGDRVGPDGDGDGGQHRTRVRSALIERSPSPSRPHREARAILGSAS